MPLKKKTKDILTEAVEKGWVEEVKSRLKWAWVLEWLKKKYKSGTPVAADSLVWAKWFKEGQVWIPWVNLTSWVKKPQTPDTSKIWNQWLWEAKTEEPIWLKEPPKETTPVDEIKPTGEAPTGEAPEDFITTPDELEPEFKAVFDTLSEQEKKQYEAIWENARKAWQDMVKAQMDYLKNWQKNKEFREAQKERELEMWKISWEITDISESQTLKNSADSVNNLKQNLSYLWNMWSPWVSAQRLDSVSNQIRDAEGVYNNILQTQKLYEEARQLWEQDDAATFEREMELLQNDLDDNVDKVIQDWLGKLDKAELDWILEDEEAIEDFRIKLLNSMDEQITWVTDANIQQRAFLLDRYDKIATEKKAYLANKNTINSEMSLAQWYYVDGNWDPIISASTWSRIEIPEEPPIAPAFDEKTWMFTTFYTDPETWAIKATTQKVYDDATFSESVISNYVNNYTQWKLWYDDVPDSVKNTEAFQSALAGVDISTAEAPEIQTVTIDWEEIDATWNPVTQQWEAVSVSWIWEELTWDLSMEDFTTNQELIEKYPLEASFKNNNPTWMTYGASPELEEMWSNALIKFGKWTARPSAEWGNYYQFASVQDWLDAYGVSLVMAGSDDIEERLKTWVWTTNEATNQAYADELMSMSWIPKWSKFSELSDNQLNTLMANQLQRESPNFYNEMLALWQPTEEPVPEWFDEASIPDFQNYYKTGKITASDQTRLKEEFGSIEEFKRQAKLYGDSNKTAQYRFASEVKELANMLRDEEWRYHRMTSWFVKYLPFGSNEADYQANLNSLKAKLSLQNLIDLKAWWATFGSLSNQELSFITNASTALKSNLSDERYKEELDKIVWKMDTILDKMELTPEQQAELDIATWETGTLQDEYKKYLPEEYKKYLPEETGAWETVKTKDPLDLWLEIETKDPLDLWLELENNDPLDLWL